jgi:hypothetical protein
MPLRKDPGVRRPLPIGVAQDATSRFRHQCALVATNKGIARIGVEVGKTTAFKVYWGNEEAMRVPSLPGRWR